MLGGGFLQTFVIKEAKKCGYYVLVLDANPNAMGFAYADEYAVINIIDETACCEYAREKKIDGVLTAATDYPVLTMSRIACELGLPGINYTSAKIVKNKARVRKILFDAKADDTGYSYEVNSLDEAKEILPEITFPRMVKPVDGSGSRGASRVDCGEDFIAACKFAMDSSITHTAVAEPFVEGLEYGVESFVYEGEIYVMGIMQKEMTLPPYYAELGHAIPSGLSDSHEEKVRACVRKAISALGINYGSVNMDLLIHGDDVHIVDIGARMGGNLIGSHVIPRGTGIEYMQNMIRAAVGDEANFKPVNAPFPIATKILALSPGKIVELPNFEVLKREFGVEIEHHLKVGDVITPYRTNLDGCGYVVSSDADIKKSVIKAAEVRKIIDKSILRE